MKTYLLYLILLLAFVLNGCHKNDSRSTSGTNKFFEDKSGHLRLEEAKKTLEFATSNKGLHNLGLLGGTYWLKIDLPKNQKDRVLEISNKFLDSVTVHFFCEETLISTQLLGALVSRDNDQLKGINPSFIIPNEANRCYLKIKTESMAFFPIKIVDKNTFTETELLHLLISGVLYGIILCVLVYNLVLFFVTKTRGRLLYTFYLSSLILAGMSLSGIGYKYIWDISPGFNYIAPNFFVSLLLLFSLLFGKEALLLKTYAPRITKFVNFSIPVSLLIVVLSFFASRQFMFTILHILPLPLLLTTLIGAVVSYKMGHTAAIYYIIGWTCFFIGSFVYEMRDMGFLPHNLITENLSSLAAGVEALLFSVSLSSQLKLLQNEKRLAEEDLVKKNDELGKLREMIETIGKNETSVPLKTYIDRQEINTYLLNPLSKRELDVLCFTAEGKSNKEISELLFISVNTVRTHLNNIYIKLDAKNRTEAVNKALSLKVIASQSLTN